MRRLLPILAPVVLLPACFVFAQQNPLSQQNPRRPLRPLQSRVQQSALPKPDLSVEPAAAPSEELDVNELQLRRKDLQGKVVELTFDRVVGLKQAVQGYTAKVTFEEPRGSTGGVTLLIPDGGLELFEDYSKPGDPFFRRRETVYVEVLGGNVTRAVGTRYSKSKPEGERYSW